MSGGNYVQQGASFFNVLAVKFPDHAGAWAERSPFAA
ncbi:hypothetical protein GXY_11703 [Novacetimonas hansenii ATCC 23769]|uniref:Uncharacterized protein n=1 Tax=Novacetimonas hansenii ATCC 23769 TaxID=714995 RepID=D5QGR8_NOVHA|nr:hypothetical protein GXY_11703 [Novacetimonas hansenii ATCC 23769]